MLAASYWSLLAPAIEMAEESGAFGAFAFLPVAVGFVLGAAFVYGADLLIPVLVSARGSLPALCPVEVTHPIKCPRFPAGVGFGELGAFPGPFGVMPPWLRAVGRRRALVPDPVLLCWLLGADVPAGGPEQPNLAWALSAKLHLLRFLRLLPRQEPDTARFLSEL